MAVIDVNYFSQALNQEVSFAAILPNDNIRYLGGPEKNRRPLKTWYLLHGMTGDAKSWLYASNLYSAVSGYPICVVMPSGMNSFWADSDTINRSFSEFVGKELVDFTRSIFPLSHEREDTFLGGVSMGGFGAVVNGLKYPETFGYVTDFSGALIKKLILHSDAEPGFDYFTTQQYMTMFGLKNNIEELIGSSVDYDALAEKLAASDRLKPRFYIDCGTEDFHLHEENHAFAEKLKGLGYDVTWDSRPGTHSMTFWNESIVKALKWLPVEMMEAGEDNPYLKANEIRTNAMEAKFY